MTGPSGGGHWEAAWAIFRKNAREVTTKAPRESPALLFAVILLGVIAIVLYIAIYAGSLV